MNSLKTTEWLKKRRILLMKEKEWHNEIETEKRREYHTKIANKRYQIPEKRLKQLETSKKYYAKHKDDKKFMSERNNKKIMKKFEDILYKEDNEFEQLFESQVSMNE